MKKIQDMSKKYHDLRDGNASRNPMNEDTPMCERHEVNYIQSEGYPNRKSHDSYSHQPHHDPNDYEKIAHKVKKNI